jgi:hypothetical protein
MRHVSVAYNLTEATKKAFVKKLQQNAIINHQQSDDSIFMDFHSKVSAAR